jgi:putative ABC transport system permease protein
MFASRWYKVFNDLWGNKTRTILIVLSIAVGLFAVGMIASAQITLSTGMERGFATINPSSGTVRTQEFFDEGFVEAVRRMEGVADVEARCVILARVETSPGQWQDITIYAVADYDAIRVNKIWPQSGAWPPPEREMLVERAALPVIGAQVGDRLTVEFPNQQKRALRIAGTAHDLIQVPAQIDNSPYAYVSYETLEWFGIPYGFNELDVVAQNRLDKVAAQNVINQVKAKAEKNGLTIPISLAAEPGQVPLNDILQALLMLMAVLGFLSLLLSVFLIINTISALLTQQKRQIGVLKAIGASTLQVMGMYLVMVCIYGVAALALAVPLSTWGAQALSQFMAAMFNFDLADLSTPAQVFVLQGALGLIVPVMASLYPFLTNLRISAAQAMSSFQGGQGFSRRNPIDRLLAGANLWFARRILRRPLLLSLRNTFRNKGRLLLTLLTLTLASALFISVFNLRAALFTTIDDLTQVMNFDVTIGFERPYRIEKIEALAAQMPAAQQVSTWLQLPARRVRPDGSESGTIFLFAIHADSPLTPPPRMLQGRWLTPQDENAVVVDTILLKDEPDVKLGSEIKLKIDGREKTWRVIGVQSGVMAPIIYANYPYVAKITGESGRANAALITTPGHDLHSVERAASEMEVHFKKAGLRVNNVKTMLAERQEGQATFQVIISLLLVMASLLALVGGLGLTGTMSINVLERTREIGVLRAIGAPSRGVSQVFIREGIAIGLLSWAFGALLAIPLSQGLGELVGTVIIGAPLASIFSTNGLGLWLAIMMLLSVLASLLPARRASLLTVREVLAYE